MKRWIAMLTLCAVLLLLCACAAEQPTQGATEPTPTDSAESTQAPTDPPETDAPTEIEDDPWMKTYAVTTQAVALPSAEDASHFFELFDAKGDIVLLAEQESLTNEEQMYSYYHTCRLVIWDTAQNAECAAWVPETDGWYCAGALAGETEAYCSLMTDYTDDVPSDYALCRLADGQTLLSRVDGAIGHVLAWNDGAVFDYWGNDGVFGARYATKDDCVDLLTWREADNAEALAGVTSVCRDAFTYVYAEDGVGTVSVVGAEGIRETYPLTADGARYDMSCLTSLGLLCGLSVGEETDDAHRELRMLDGGEVTATQRRSASEALYAPVFSGVIGLATDSYWQLQVIALTGDKIDVRSLQDEALDAYRGQAARFLSADDVSFYVFYFAPETQALFRVIAAPAA